ncbi:ATP-grasp domain-containing protein [Gulosibacter chungangensis]|uniref:Alpha-L-glutamate ligase n=1 Tax=Gulosibacter chungangensis TaxID=979746 RepID=A0A7J5B9S8_9MICO|nr:alpha-L-glutamate ligase [Gulosibacter chungangensis]KAB1642586.1 alpha-L-glutamate ligase [Gulosibacter chungangensis]
MTNDQNAPAVYILHENPEWLPALRTGFEAENVPYRELELTTGAIDVGAEPPQGVFWSRLSASSHTRGNDHAKEYARAILRWLEAHGRRVVNGSRVLELEVSKVAQYTALAAVGFDAPKTTAVFGKDALSEQARNFELPFITKHNQGGKGLGVRRFDSYEEFDAYVASDEFEEPIDGITLLQEYIATAEPFITRAEFIGGKLHYAVRVDTSAGSFELCPAEACAVPADGEAEADALPAIDVAGLTVAASDLGGFVAASAACEVPADSGLFRIRPEITAETPLIAKLEKFLAEQGIEVAGIEFFETADGRTVVYDINTNTNYNPDVEATVELAGARKIARVLGEELATLHQPA